jgi:hypothetical protein
MRFLSALLVGALLFALPSRVDAQITGLNSFSPNTRILSADVNFNFTKLADEALRRTGGAITGNITVDAAVTIDGIDLSAWLDQSVKIAATPTFAGLTVTGAGASALDVAGGINAGSGNVGIVDTTGKIPAISSTYFASLSGTNLTGVGLLDSTNAWGGRQDFNANYTETRTAPTISAGALTLNLNNGTHFDVALNANVTSLTISNPPISGRAGSFTLVFTADGTPRTVSWPASVKWAGATAPTLTSANGKKDVFTFITYDGGTSWLGFIAGLNF